MEKFQQQATNFGTEFRYEEVKRTTRTDSRGDGSYGSNNTDRNDNLAQCKNFNR
jgi:hypothetical protein